MALAASLASAGWAAFLPAPHAASWPCIGLSVALHVAYNLLLVMAYRHGDLGVTYPIARGSSPLLVAAGAAILAGERLDAFTLIGIALICGGILGLAREIRGKQAREGPRPRRPDRGDDRRLHRRRWPREPGFGQRLGVCSMALRGPRPGDAPGLGLAA